MKYEIGNYANSNAAPFVHPYRENFKNHLLKKNGMTRSILDKVKIIHQSPNNLTKSYIDELLHMSVKAEDWLEICFYSEQDSKIDHEKLWLGGLEKFNSSGLYLENLGYFYYQRGKYHKALDYLSKSHALERSFFALCLAIAAAYAVTQFHLVLDYYHALSDKDRNTVNDELLMKVATAAQYEKQYDLALTIFEKIRKQNDVAPLPELKQTMISKFGSMEKMKAWMKGTRIIMDNKSKRNKLSLEDIITFASTLILHDKFDDALHYLEDIKKDRYPKAS